MMVSVSQQAQASTAKSALIGAAVVAASAGLGAVIGYKQNTDYKGLGAAGGGIFGAGAASLGGAIVAASSKKWHKAGLATAILGLSSIGAVFVGTALSKALQPAPLAGPLPPSPSPPVPQPPRPSPGIAWTQIPLTTLLQTNVVYRLSDVETASEQANPPSLATVQASMAQSGLQTDGVWIGTPPAGWPASDVVGSQPRIYVEFSSSNANAPLPSGLTAGARLFVQQATA